MYEAILLKTMFARQAAHDALAIHESSKSRVVHLDRLFLKLGSADPEVRDYLGESLRCLEGQLFRAAVILSWAGFFHVFSKSLVDGHLEEIKVKRPSWKFSTPAELREIALESFILTVGREIGFISKAQLRIFDGQLSTRNVCAHPTGFRPTLNQAVGFVDQMIDQMRLFAK